MAIFDLHCDTLTRNLYPPFEAETDTLDNPNFHLALSKVPAGTKWVQCFAIFVPDQVRGQEAITFFDRYAGSFHRQVDLHKDRAADCGTAADMAAALDAGKCAAVLTVEGGAALAGRLERVETLHHAGVRMMTLTWNGPNELASGHDTAGGFTPFGREAVAEMERQGIIVDVSHLNDRGFEELLSFARKPFAASHSNARAVCGHRRNLTDEQIAEMVRRDCLIGLNYAQNFLRTGDRPATVDDLFRHVEHFLELGAADCLALGSDADGTDVPPGLDCPEKFAGLYQYFLDRGLSSAQAENILWRNAFRFMEKNLVK